MRPVVVRLIDPVLQSQVQPMVGLLFDPMLQSQVQPVVGLLLDSMVPEPCLLGSGHERYF